MSSALCVFIHASETGHAEGVPIAPSRGRSVSFPILRELWLHTFETLISRASIPTGSKNHFREAPNLA